MVMKKPTKLNKRSIVLVQLILVTSIIVILGLNIFNCNPNKMVLDTKPVKYFKIEKLIDELNFEENAFSDFKEHVVAIEGFVEDVNSLNNRQTVILRDKDNRNTSVICDMQKDQTVLLDSLELGDQVTIKGIFKGALKDIILLNCIIFNQTNQ